MQPAGWNIAGRACCQCVPACRGVSCLLPRPRAKAHVVGLCFGHPPRVCCVCFLSLQACPGPACTRACPTCRWTGLRTCLLLWRLCGPACSHAAPSSAAGQQVRRVDSDTVSLLHPELVELAAAGDRAKSAGAAGCSNGPTTGGAGHAVIAQSLPAAGARLARSNRVKMSPVFA